MTGENLLWGEIYKQYRCGVRVYEIISGFHWIIHKVRKCSNKTDEVE